MKRLSLLWVGVAVLGSLAGSGCDPDPAWEFITTCNVVEFDRTECLVSSGDCGDTDPECFADYLSELQEALCTDAGNTDCACTTEVGPSCG